MKKISFIIALTLTSIATAAPQIDPKRVDTLLHYLKQSAQAQERQLPPDDQLRADLEQSLLRNEVLKEQAIKVGLDKLPDTQALLANAQAEVYASRFMHHLIEQEKIGEGELMLFYRKQNRLVRIEQVAFTDKAGAQAALDLLSKGLSFEELVKRYPNPQQSVLNQMISPTDLPEEFIPYVLNMTRGAITPQPVEYKGRFFLIKVAEESINPKTPPLEKIRDAMTMALKTERAQQKVRQILQQNGLKP